MSYFKSLDVASIMLINVKIPTIVDILTFMGRIYFVLSWVEHEKSFITSGLGYGILSTVFYRSFCSQVSNLGIAANIIGDIQYWVPWRYTHLSFNDMWKKSLFSVLREFSERLFILPSKRNNSNFGRKPLETILREKSLAMYFEDSQFRRNRTFNHLVSKIYVDKRSRLRLH